MTKTFFYNESERINFENAGIRFNLDIFSFIKYDLKLNESFNVQLENYSEFETKRFTDKVESLIIDFDENFDVTIDKNIVQIRRIGLNESHKVNV